MAETIWQTPTFDDLFNVISMAVIASANENTDPGSIAQTLANPTARTTWDPTLDHRAGKQLGLAVAQFRAAIQLGGKIPLSVTPGTVPPEVFKHVLWVAAFGVLASTLNLKWVIATEKGDISPMTKQFGIAQKYMDGLAKGWTCVPPSEPTGRDYQTTINVRWCGNPAQNPFPAYDSTRPINQPVESFRFGGKVFADLTTFDGIFGETPGWWPSQELGQP